MSESSPWDEISIPGSDFNVRRVAGNMVMPCYWGRDKSGACLFVMEIAEDLSDDFKKNNISVKGLELELRKDGTAQRLILTLEKSSDRDIFEGLCRSLVKALENARIQQAQWP